MSCLPPSLSSSAAACSSAASRWPRIARGLDFLSLRLRLASLLFFAALAGAAAPVQAGVVYVNMITVCNDAGTGCASTGPGSDLYYMAATNKIFAQAGVTVSVASTTSYNSTTFLDLSSANNYLEFDQLINGASHGQSALSHVLNVWFVNTIAGSWGITSQLGGKDIAISDDIFGANRLDTIAHEIGHALGLDHILVQDNLMAPGAYNNASYRYAPSSIANIAPDGLGYDKLSADQIQIIGNSNYVLDDLVAPETPSLALLFLGLGVMAAVRRRPLV